jgi:hypothetical protein
LSQAGALISCPVSSPDKDLLTRLRLAWQSASRSSCVSAGSEWHFQVIFAAQGMTAPLAWRTRPAARVKAIQAVAGVNRKLRFIKLVDGIQNQNQRRIFALTEALNSFHHLLPGVMVIGGGLCAISSSAKNQNSRLRQLSSVVSPSAPI